MKQSQTFKKRKGALGRKKFSFINSIKRFDLFSKPLPSFTLKGSERFNTLPGAALSLLLGFVVLIYATAKSSDLENSSGAHISKYLEDSLTNLDNKIDISGDSKFKAAFSFKGIHDGELKNDPKYVRWIFRVSGKKNNEYFEQVLPLKACTA